MFIHSSHKNRGTKEPIRQLRRRNQWRIQGMLEAFASPLGPISFILCSFRRKFCQIIG